MRTQSTALPTGAARDKHFVVRFCAPRHEKTEASWLIPIRVPIKNEILAEKNPHW
jgi:hypothetical protein